jgi:hypothetical protein
MTQEEAGPMPPKSEEVTVKWGDFAPLTEDRVREIVREELGIVTNEALRSATSDALKLLNESGFPVDMGDSS